MGPKSGSLFKFNTNPVFESYFQGLFLNLILGPIFLRNIYECSMIFARYHLRFWFASVCSHVIGQRELGRTLLAWQVCLPFLDPKNKTRGLRNLELRRMSDMFCHSFLLLPCVTSGLSCEIVKLNVEELSIVCSLSVSYSNEIVKLRFAEIPTLCSLPRAKTPKS